MEIEQLKDAARRIRLATIRSVHAVGTGHVGGALRRLWLERYRHRRARHRGDPCGICSSAHIAATVKDAIRAKA